MSEYIHPCVTLTGGGDGCPKCCLYNDQYRGSFCRIWIEEVLRALGGSLKGLDKMDQEDIISESFKDIIKGFTGFRGTHQAQFRLWTRRIISCRKADFFRNKDRQKNAQGLDNHEIVIRRNEDTDEIEIDIKDKRDIKDKDLQIDIKSFLSQLIRKMIESGDDKCAKLILDYYKGVNEGLSHNEIAERRGEKPNTFNQGLKRCLNRIRERLSSTQIWKDMRKYLP